MKATIACLLMSLPILLCGGCETGVADRDAGQGEILEFRGAVVFVELEGPFYGIRGDSGVNYDPINLPAEYQIDGLRVGVVAVEMPDMASIHMWGRVIRVLAIERESDLPFN